MSSTAFDGDRIGPELDLADLAIAPHVGEHLAAAYGVEGRIETGAEWVAAIRAGLESTDGGPPTTEDLCHDADGAHSVHRDGEADAFVCVLDPLVVPFLEGRPATVRSETPTDGATVEIEVGGGEATAKPADAVISIGVARDLDPDAPLTRERIYAETCPYVHAFASVGEYETWAAGTDAATTSYPVETGVAIARELAAALFDARGESAD